MSYTEDQVVATVETLSVERLRRWVAEGWIIPATGEAVLTFTEIDVARVRLVCHLTDELDVGEEAVPVILSLLDQVHGLRGELKRLAGAIERQPETVRDAIRRELEPDRTG
ncbi:chaperone modulator CbpM [Amorphus orientalis]|uniref:Chaperone modulatory protein CbpM n=1 Tax=Amorphus orientalis TaxID=649198 RepID=A0AAE3VKB8_9HYPH|nr:chaperone modulator CbpM [Amorphus orientalis]MDQ0313597.1 chaperone modulatory protein CbpM [Amorphus orientalis]